MDGSACHVWTSGPEAPELRARVAILSSEERAQAERFAFDRDRELYRTAHVLTRLALSACEPKVPPGEWVFTNNRHGRPEIAGPGTSSRLRFSISHTAGLVACVVTTDVDCGVDVERVDRELDIESLAGAALTPPELEAIRLLPHAARAESFFRRWTLKEAYAKARGLGMALPFHQLAVDFGPPIRIVASRSIESQTIAWQMASWPVESHLAAVALRQGSGSPLEIIRHSELPMHSAKL